MDQKKDENYQIDNAVKNVMKHTCPFVCTTPYVSRPHVEKEVKYLLASVSAIQPTRVIHGIRGGGKTVAVLKAIENVKGAYHIKGVIVVMPIVLTHFDFHQDCLSFFLFLLDLPPSAGAQ